MPQATEVKASKWKDVRILFDNGIHSIIIGWYISEAYPEGSLQLGSRWNGDDDAGYPKLFGNPVFYVIPDGMEMGILNHLPVMLNNDRDKLVGDINAYRDNLIYALNLFIGSQVGKALTSPI